MTNSIIALIVDLITESEAHASEQQQLFHVLVDKLVCFRNRRLWHKNNIFGLEPEVASIHVPVQERFQVNFDRNRPPVSEGATEGRRLYREAYLMQALEAMQGAQAGRALDLVARARQWPEHLGAGKPYPEDVDERLEDFLQAQALRRLGNTAEAGRLLDELASNGRAGLGAGALVAALAAREVGRGDRAEALVDAWQSGQREDSAAWARGVLAGRRAPLPEALAPDEGYRVLAAWLK